MNLENPRPAKGCQRAQTERRSRDLGGHDQSAPLTRVGDAVVKAATGEGSLQDRLAAALTAVLHALAEHPVLSVELSTAVKQTDDFQEVMTAVDRVVLAPLRGLLEEGRAIGELHVADVPATAIALMGALNTVGMMQVVTTGTIDAEGTAPTLVSQLINGLVKR